MNKNNFFKRTPFDPATMDHLEKERILIVGVGSGGSLVALELAKAGIGTIIAADKDILEAHNCMRHVLGTNYIGMSKSAGLKDFLKTQAPMCNCIAIEDDIFKNNCENLKDIIERTQPTRILALTDSLHIQYLCQLTALYFNLPMLTIWCDNNAVEGEIFIWNPGQALGWKQGYQKRGCYGCLRNPNKISSSKIERPHDYTSDRKYAGIPALGTFINRINNIGVIMALAWILHDCPTSTELSKSFDEYYEDKGLQYIRLGGPYPYHVDGQITAKNPWGVEWYRVEKRDECPFCNSDNLEEILFYETKEEDQFELIA